MADPLQQLRCLAITTIGNRGGGGRQQRLIQLPVTPLELLRLEAPNCCAAINGCRHLSTPHARDEEASERIARAHPRGDDERDERGGHDLGRNAAPAQRHGRAMLDAQRRGDTVEAQRLQRLRDQAYARHEKARAATLFPWEI